MNPLNKIEEVKEVISKEDIVVALFSDLSCNVCLAITPDLIQMAEEHPKVAFISMDTEVVKAMVGECLIFAYPTIIVFAQGKESGRFERLFSMMDIEETVSRLESFIF